MDPTSAGRPPPERPEPEIRQGFPEFEVEEVLNNRIYRAKQQFLVKWKGFSPADNSWEPVENLTHAREAIEDFFGAHPERRALAGGNATIAPPRGSKTHKNPAEGRVRKGQDEQTRYWLRGHAQKE